MVVVGISGGDVVSPDLWATTSRMGGDDGKIHTLSLVAQPVAVGGYRNGLALADDGPEGRRGRSSPRSPYRYTIIVGDCVDMAWHEPAMRSPAGVDHRKHLSVGPDLTGSGARKSIAKLACSWRSDHCHDGNRIARVGRP